MTAAVSGSVDISSHTTLRGAVDPHIAALRAPRIRAPTRLRPVRYSIIFAPAYDTALRSAVTAGL